MNAPQPYDLTRDELRSLGAWASRLRLRAAEFASTTGDPEAERFCSGESHHDRATRLLREVDALETVIARHPPS